MLLMNSADELRTVLYFFDLFGFSRKNDYANVTSTRSSYIPRMYRPLVLTVCRRRDGKQSADKKAVSDIA